MWIFPNLLCVNSESVLAQSSAHLCSVQKDEASPVANSNLSFDFFVVFFTSAYFTSRFEKMFAWWWNKAAVGAEQNQLGLVVNAGLHGDPKNFSTFFWQSTFYDIYRDLKNLSSFFFCIKISQLLDYLDGRQSRRWNLSKGKEGMFASALPRTGTTSATKGHFHFSLHQISNFHSHTAAAALRLNMLSKIWGEACCLIPSHLRWTYSRNSYPWSSNIIVLS